MARNCLVGMAAIGVVSALSACTQTPPVNLSVSPPNKIAYASDIAPLAHADALWQLIGSAPPDFAFNMDGYEPWAWKLQDGHYILMEDIPLGRSLRSYYFAPGDQLPFLVTDANYSYVIEQGRVVRAYTLGGVLMGPEVAGPLLAGGSGLADRGRALRAAAEREHRLIYPGSWADAGYYVDRFQRQWANVRREADWERVVDSVHERAGGRTVDLERSARVKAAADFKAWGAKSFASAPPPGFAPSKPGRAVEER